MICRIFRSYLWTGLVIFGLLFFKFYFFLTTIDKNFKTDETYLRVYESILCRFTEIKKVEGTRPAPCPTQGIITAFGNGPLSNIMWMYANVLAATNIISLNAYIPTCMKEALENVFANITIPLLSTIGHCQVSLSNSISNIDDWIDVQQSIVINAEDLYTDVVIRLMDSIRSHFEFNEIMKDVARKYLLEAKPENTTNVIYVGLYITQMINTVDDDTEDNGQKVRIFEHTMDHFRKKYPNSVFVVITDQKPFWEKIFGKTDVYILDEKSLTLYGATLSLLSHCNHTILASDGFGVWGAILSGGETLVSPFFLDFQALINHFSNWNYLYPN